MIRTFDALIANPAGLHARVAATFAKAARAGDAFVHVEDLTNGMGPVDGKSIIAILGLGAIAGHCIRVTCEGPGASPLAEELQAIVTADSRLP